MSEQKIPVHVDELYQAELLLSTEEDIENGGLNQKNSAVA